ncbi:MAG: hypothetical protein XE07_0776 [Methanothrix harundinacea]|jgi:hypothetical protein|uniref:Uncharacterized protein n=1 Tax=Methanothrix harundinacea TaxID=301375 RepID=A0A101IL04_9EURY|nr:MAG: hypothetical protein XE07_0776 [Methanothrix harundinacea]
MKPILALVQVVLLMAADMSKASQIRRITGYI